MNFEVGCISSIPDDKLKELCATMAVRLKDARRKIGILLKNNKDLMFTWVNKLGTDPPKALPEEVVEIRNQRKREFELALLSNPEAFVAFQVYTFLVSLNDELRREKIRRAPPPKSKGTA